MQRPDAPPAPDLIDRLRAEVARNPGGLDASLMLGSALYQSGNYAESAAVFRSLLNQHPDHPQALLLLARTLARAGHTAEALTVLARAQQVNPANIQGWQVAAALASDIRLWPELLRIGQEWTQAHPGSHQAWQALSRAHFEASRFSDAITAYRRVLALKPDDPAVLIGAARLAIAAGHYAQARSHLDAAQAFAADDPELLYTFCRLHHLSGDLAQAEHYCRRAIAARPGFATAYVELGALCEGRLSDAEIQVIRQLFEDPAIHPEYRVMLAFTLGDALDRRDRHNEAFAAWEQGNDINRRLSEQEGIFYQPELIDSELQLLPVIFDGLHLTLPATDAGHPPPIFVVGMPRSGTTLIESILAAHSQVYGAGELPALYDIHEELMAVARRQGVQAARALVQQQAAGWRQRYLDGLPADTGKSCVVDKQPLNFRSIGLIRLLFPQSPIIYVQRDALDVGFSIYRHKFAKDWPCAHRLADIGHYFSVHARIVAHWQRCHVDALHVVDYATLVRDPTTGIEQLLGFVDLDLEPACLSHHNTRRAVATFSAVQVQRPISARYSGRSAHYVKQLSALRDALVNNGIDPGNGIDVAEITHDQA